MIIGVAVVVLAAVLAAVWLHVARIYTLLDGPTYRRLVAVLESRPPWTELVDDQHMVLIFPGRWLRSWYHVLVGDEAAAFDGMDENTSHMTVMPRRNFRLRWRLLAVHRGGVPISTDEDAVMLPPHMSWLRTQWQTIRMIPFLVRSGVRRAEPGEVEQLMGMVRRAETRPDDDDDDDRDMP